MFQPRPVSKYYLVILGCIIGIILISSLSAQSKSTATDTSISARQAKVDYLSKVVKLLYKENLVIYEGIEKFYSSVSNITAPSKTKIEKNMKILQLSFRKLSKTIEKLG